ncbi:primase-like DNA-binding domain-containing protein [Streptomyces sp. NBC_01643]|uniref:primase-like DNA-binding domain-containing protein n=1 Tax=Streptomyces sp. NBC_01643 TaxID=2975906 RepID=UPI002F910D04|nr:hypothetical protein OHB03_48975 [Streptomyces sp. NBC_01643]
MVPFDVVIPPEERDGGLPDRLKKAAPAVLAWIHDGWLSYQEQGLNPPEVIRVRTQEYQASSDVLGRFLDERTIKNPHCTIKARELFTAWSAWCSSSGEQAGTEKSFADSLGQRGYTKKRTNAGQVYQGLMLAGTDDEDD